MTSLISTGETSAKKLYEAGASKVLESLAGVVDLALERLDA
ncbi:MAG: hypothetical protein ACW99G_13685 [Candidatus Thorarchaeota archaeon]|jgi:hypothetical protein